MNTKREKISKEQLREFFLGLLRVNLRQPEDDGTVSRECEMFPELEEYLVAVDENMDGTSYLMSRVRPEHLNALGIAENGAWAAAVEKTSGSIQIDEICSVMNELAADIFGVQIFPKEELEDPFSLYVLTNDIRFAGAGAILYSRELLKDVSKDIGINRWIAYPASSHEWILEPDIGAGKLEDRVSIMQEADSENGQDNRLIDKVYYLTV